MSFFKFGRNRTQSPPTPNDATPGFVLLDNINVIPSQPNNQNILPAIQDASILPKKRRKSMMEFTSGWPRVELALRIYCSLAALCMIAAAIKSFGWSNNCKPGYFIVVNTWLIILGAISILVEWRQRHVQAVFSFLAFKTGRGFFYIFAGSLATGISDNVGLVLGLAIVAAGLFTLLFAALARQKKKETARPPPQQNAGQQPVQQAPSQKQAQPQKQTQQVPPPQEVQTQQPPEDPDIRKVKPNRFMVMLGYPQDED
eukprot:TRINITY_DN6980_c0_g1_i1.p1 TRINITY_DN6980_c0_g1~~TRINITY_DN6980_c0_g1_i1.p1  ORF type:complete len:257 (-),score=28.20 TRINITY_DN6980_c0_g1_i1:45-815(-)